MTAAPSLLLILGSIILALWRPSGRRAGWIAEVSFTGLALVAGLLLATLIPARSVLSAWPLDEQIELAVTPWSWTLLVCVLGLAVSRALSSGIEMGAAGRTVRAASLAFAAATAFATLASSLLTLVLGWALAIAAQVWLVTATLPAADRSPLRLLQGRDFAALLLAMTAFGMAEGSSPISAALVIGLLIIAGILRVSSAVAVARRGDGLVARLGLPTAVSVLAALTWIWQGEGAGVLSPWMLAGSSLFIFAGWIGATVSETEDQRAIAWIAGIGGIGLMAGAAASNAQAGLAFSGSVMALAGALGFSLQAGRISSRVSAATGAALTVGVPGLVGALLLGVLVPAGAPSAIGWVGVVGLGLMASPLLWVTLRPESPKAGDGAFGLSAVSAGLIGILGIILYIRLRPLVPDPTITAVLVSSSVALTVALIGWRIPAHRRTRIARALRWPSVMRRSGESFGPTAAAGGFVRGIRDILEGDASLLWALVVVVVGLLLLQGVA